MSIMVTEGVAALVPAQPTQNSLMTINTPHGILQPRYNYKLTLAESYCPTNSLELWSQLPLHQAEGGFPRRLLWAGHGPIVLNRLAVVVACHIPQPCTPTPCVPPHFLACHSGLGLGTKGSGTILCLRLSKQLQSTGTLLVDNLIPQVGIRGLPNVKFYNCNYPLWVGWLRFSCASNLVVDVENVPDQIFRIHTFLV